MKNIKKILFVGIVFLGVVAVLIIVKQSKKEIVQLEKVETVSKTESIVKELIRPNLKDHVTYPKIEFDTKYKYIKDKYKRELARPDGSIVFYGKITDIDGNPIKNSKVEIKDYFNQKLVSTTDENGDYEIVANYFMNHRNESCEWVNADVCNYTYTNIYLTFDGDIYISHDLDIGLSTDGPFSSNYIINPGEECSNFGEKTKFSCLHQNNQIK